MITWLFPERCAVCKAPVLPRGALVHSDCGGRLKPIREPYCKGCGRPVREEIQEYCKVCKKTPPLWEAGRCLFPYQGEMGETLRLVKREGTKEFVRFFGEQLAEECQLFLKQIRPDCIVPVPLHRTKLRSRGFNQAELLARELGSRTGIPVCNLLIKRKKTKDQKLLTGAERRRNLRHAFAVSVAFEKEESPQTVLLLDDVLTTGSTLRACTETLRQHGVRHVYVICVCVGNAEG